MVNGLICPPTGERLKLIFLAYWIGIFPNACWIKITPTVTAIATNTIKQQLRCLETTHHLDYRKTGCKVVASVLDGSHNTGKNDNRNTVTDTICGNLFT